MNDDCCKVLKIYVVEWSLFFGHVSREMLLPFLVTRESGDLPLRRVESSVGQRKGGEDRSRLADVMFGLRNCELHRDRGSPMIYPASIPPPDGGIAFRPRYILSLYRSP
jgi:hypothetical protein